MQGNILVNECAHEYNLVANTLKERTDMDPNNENKELCENCQDSNTLYGMFFRCSHILRRRVGNRVSRRRILKLLLEHGALTQCELQERLGIQAGSFSELAAKMEKRNLIKRERDVEDRRRIVLRLTEDGKTAAAQSEEIRDEELFSALTPEEQEALQGMLQKIIDAHLAWKRKSGLQ